MFSYIVWEKFVIEKATVPWVNGILDLVEFIAYMFLSLFLALLDFLLAPLEIIGMIIYKIKED